MSTDEVVTIGDLEVGDRFTFFPGGSPLLYLERGASRGAAFSILVEDEADPMVCSMTFDVTPSEKVILVRKGVPPPWVSTQSS